MPHFPMHRAASFDHRAACFLAVFVIGGLLAPVVHRAHHGLTWASLRGAESAATACDHSKHGKGLETPLPAFHDDLCPLCLSHVRGLAAPDAAAVVPRVAASWASPQPLAPGSGHGSLFLIRGPPHA